MRFQRLISVVSIFLVHFAGTLLLTIQPANANDDTSVTETSNGGSSPFSVSLLGSYGMSKWDLEGINISTPLDLKKLGIGFGLRYEFSNSPFFVANRFYYHPKGQADPFHFVTFIGTDTYRIEEKWKNQILLGWTFFENNGVRLNFLGGVTLAEINFEIENFVTSPQPNSTFFENSEIQVAPTLGFDFEAPLTESTMGQIYWVAGGTFALMNSHSLANVLDEEFTIDSNLQWDIHTGFRIRF